MPDPIDPSLAAHKPRTVRKKRIDAGRRRKPDPTAHDQFRRFYLTLGASERELLKRDIEVMDAALETLKQPKEASKETEGA